MTISLYEETRNTKRALWLAFLFGRRTAVNGWRGDTDLNECIRFDLDYIERWSLLFDAYIMLLTFARNKNAY